MIVKALYVLEKVQKSYKNVQKKCPKQNENWTFFQLKPELSDSLKRYIKKSVGGSSAWVYLDITKASNFIKWSMRNIIKIADFVITKNTAKDDDYFCEIKKAGAVI